jgi:predicted nicotinamide N-methyase
VAREPFQTGHESITERTIPGGWSEREVLGQLELPSADARPHFADPYWAKLWPAAPLLAAAIVRDPPPRGTRVLELGCGSGLAGIAALASGLDVTFSDYVPLAVELALENAARNGFPAARGLVLDWRQPREERFDLIIAADVTYDRLNLPPLLGVLVRMLLPGGQAWFGDAGRSPAEDFCHLARSDGWRVTLYDEHDQVTPGLSLGHYRRIVLRRV